MKIHPLLFILLTVQYHLDAVIIGSDTVVSRQAAATFPAAALDNKLLGFAVFDNGFRLESKSTKAIFDDFYPLNGPINIGGGIITLNQDFVVYNNSNFFIGGSFIGNNYAINLRNNIPSTSGSCGTYYLATVLQTLLSQRGKAIDFNYQNNFIAVGTQAATSDDELIVFNFDNISVTRVASTELRTNILDLAWHPSNNSIAITMKSTAGSDFSIFSFDSLALSLTLTGTWNSQSDVNAVAWHPSGKWIVISTSNTAQSIGLFSVSSGGALTNRQIINPSGGAIAPNPNTISWSPGGNYVGFGYTTRPGGEVEIFSFDGAQLTSTVSLEIGQSVLSLDWSPTGTFIAIGLSVSVSDGLRILQHSVSNGTLTQVTSDAALSNVVGEVSWSQNGNCLIAATGTGASSTSINYFFNKTAKTLTTLQTFILSSGFSAASKSSNDGFYAVAGASTNDIQIFASGTLDSTFGVPSDFVLSNLTLGLTNDIAFQGRMFFQGACRIDGQGTNFSLNGGGLFVRPGSSLIIQDLTIDGITSNNFSCITDSGDITLRNVNLILSNNYTFSKGAILFDTQDTLITDDKQNRIFTFSTKRTSTIGSQASLIIDNGVTFSYVPPVAKKNLLFFTDKTSVLFLNGATLSTTFTGLKLDTGTLLLDNHVTISCAGRNSGESLDFGTNLTINLNSNALVDLYGPIKIL